MARTHPFAETAARPEPHASEGVTPAPGWVTRGCVGQVVATKTWPSTTMWLPWRFPVGSLPRHCFAGRAPPRRQRRDPPRLQGTPDNCRSPSVTRERFALRVLLPGRTRPCRGGLHVRSRQPARRRGARCALPPGRAYSASNLTVVDRCGLPGSEDAAIALFPRQMDMGFRGSWGCAGSTVLAARPDTRCLCRVRAGLARSLLAGSWVPPDGGLPVDATAPAAGTTATLTCAAAPAQCGRPW